jgi:hypothetical protein
MIEAAEASGQLQPGGTTIEATAGNTGLWVWHWLRFVKAIACNWWYRTK